jgi:hypothetical protein
MFQAPRFTRRLIGQALRMRSESRETTSEIDQPAHLACSDPRGKVKKALRRSLFSPSRIK